jgi:hypothetical protein
VFNSKRGQIGVGHQLAFGVSASAKIGEDVKVAMPGPHSNKVWTLPESFDFPER